MSPLSAFPPNGFRSVPARQRGVALVIALVVLFILTILGVSALVSTALEGLMAGNVQEQNRAFQAAETGIDAALARADAYVAVRGQAVTGSATAIGGYNASASYTSTYQGQTDPPRSGKASSAEKVKVNRFKTESVGVTANNGATATLTRGMYQIGPAAQ